MPDPVPIKERAAREQDEKSVLLVNRMRVMRPMLLGIMRREINWHPDNLSPSVKILEPVVL